MLPNDNHQQNEYPHQVKQETVVDQKTQLQRDIASFPEVVTAEGVTMQSLRVGNILDAQDYLGGWYPAIVIDEKDSENKQIHFLPYKSNRDEYFKSSED